MTLPVLQVFSIVRAICNSIIDNINCPFKTDLVAGRDLRSFCEDNLSAHYIILMSLN